MLTMLYQSPIVCLIFLSIVAPALSATVPTAAGSTVQSLTDCGPPNKTANGVVDYVNTTFSYSANYSCNIGYNLNGTNETHCSANGTWDDPAPDCVIVDCGPPNKTANGVVDYVNTTFSYSANYSCNIGYNLNGTNETYCSANGTWDDPAPDCVIVDCGPPNKTANGVVDYVNTTFSYSANYSCNIGYNLNGTNETYCSANGTWDDPAPDCVIVDCGQPSNITNGNYSLVGQSTNYSSIALYTCIDRYRLNGSVNFRKCLANGTWAGDIGQCEPVVCANLSSPGNGSVLYTKDIAAFTCNESFSIVGSDRLFCLMTGNWSAPVPRCVKVNVEAKDCPKNQDSRKEVWNATKAGKVVTLPCPEGQQGFISRNCTVNGIWLLPRYMCVREEIILAEHKIDAVLTANATQDVKSVVVSDVLGDLSKTTNSSSSTDITQTINDGEIEKVTSILAKVDDISQGIVVTGKQSQDFIGTTSNLLDPDNSESFKSIDQNNVYQDSSQTSGAAKMLNTVGSFTKAIANSQDISTDNTTVKTKNLVVTVAKVNQKKDVTFPEQRVNSLTSAEISQSALEGVGSYSGIFYKNLSGLLPSRLDNNGNVDDSSFEINAPVMDIQLLNITGTPDDFQITLNFENFLTGNNERKCTFWNFSRNLWDQSGCSLDASKTNQSVTVCTCNHTTNFAILMNPSQTPNVDSKTLDFISIIGCSVSFICLVVTIVMYAVHWRFLKSDRAIILINLAVALSLSYAIFLGGVDRTEIKVACKGIAIALHYIYLVVFFLMMSEGIEIFITIVYVFVTKSRLKWLLVISWGLPVIIVGISAAVTKTEGYGSRDFCWLSIKDGLIWAFIGPALAVIITNFILLVMVIKAMFKVSTLKQKSKTEQVKAGVRSLCVLLPLTGCTWVLGVFYVDESMAWVQYVFAALNSLQGLFIMIFQCILNSQMKLAIQRRLKGYKASSSFTQSSSNQMSIPRPASTAGLYNHLYKRSTDGDSSAGYDVINPAFTKD